MKTTLTAAVLILMTALCGCSTSSPLGGGVTKEEGFTIGVPRFATNLKQGEVRTIPISLNRGKHFMQDVELTFESPVGVSIEPSTLTLLASKLPEGQIKIQAASDAPFGEYPIRVTGTPKTGEPTTATFRVKVVTP